MNKHTLPLAAALAVWLVSAAPAKAAPSSVCSRTDVVCYYVPAGAGAGRPEGRHLVALGASGALFGPYNGYDAFPRLAENVRRTYADLDALDVRGAQVWRKGSVAALVEIRRELMIAKRDAEIDPNDLPTHWEDLAGKAAANIRVNAELDKKIAAVDAAERALGAALDGRPNLERSEGGRQ